MHSTLRTRVPLLALAWAALIGALWGGLLRLGWAWPTPQTSLALLHGPLMVCGFLGTLIGLERAVALDQRWAYAAPGCTALGGLSLLLGAPLPVGALLIAFGSAVLVAVFGTLLRRQPALYMAIMTLGALLWLVGNLLWLGGQPIFAVVLWWANFLVLTIAGERLELGRLVRLPRSAHVLFVLVIAALLAGTLDAGVDWANGVRIAGAGYALLALWLLRFDLARRTIRKPGLTRFIAVCLLSGYVWLGIGGVIGFWYGGVPAGPIYDALLHAIFVGFVIAMIFGHAPIIFPAVLHVPIAFNRSFYAHLVLLHVSLAIRIAGDLGGVFVLRRSGGLLNAVAILLFMALTVTAARRARRPAATTLNRSNQQVKGTP
jgi:hypothetical protein